MAFTLGATTTVGISTATSRSQSHTVASGVRLLVVAIAVRGASTLTNVKYGGVSMTLADEYGDPGDFERLAIYYLVDPAVGTANVTYTVSSGEQNGATVSSWSCTDTPELDVVAHGSNLSTSSVSASLSGAVGTLMISAVNGEDNSNPGLTKAADETLILNNWNGSFGTATAYKLSPASNENSTWTKNGGGEVAVVVLACFKEVAGGGGGTPQELAAVIAGVSTVVAVLRVEKPLRGTIAGTSTVTGALKVQKPLAASITGTSSVSAALATAGSKLLAATIEGTSTVTAGLAVTKNLAATIAGTSSVNAALQAAKRLGATIGGTSTVTASLTSAKTLAATIASSSSMASALRIGKPLAATIAGTSSVIARLLVETGVAATGRVYQSLQMIRTRIGW